MDLLLSSFVSKNINNLTLDELKKLEVFLNCNDDDISNFYLNNIPIQNYNDKKILDLFIGHKIK